MNAKQASCTIALPQYPVGTRIEYGKRSYTIKRRLYDHDADSYFYICWRTGDRKMVAESEIVLSGNQNIGNSAG